jgi:ferredoxin
MNDRFVYLRNVATLRLDEEKCTGCGMCLEVCPHEVFQRVNGKVRVVDHDLCMECGACARNCFAEAVTVVSGVGCAMAVINSALGRDASSCCCIIESAPSDSGAVDATKANGRTGCC